MNHGRVNDDNEYNEVMNLHWWHRIHGMVFWVENVD